MSEIMQAGRPREYKTSNFAEGRLKLSTSCTECHKRKQKCDQKQPCKRCARRYPPPQCIYLTVKGTSTSVEHLKVAPRPDAVEELPLLRPLISSDDSSSIDGSSSSSSLLFRVPTPIIPKHLHDAPTSTISAKSLDDFNQDSYQNLLSTMVSRISGIVLSDNIDLDICLQEPSKQKQPSLNETSYGILPNNGALVKCPQTHRRDSLGYNEYVAPPSSFSITSADPLHFLGITPTARNGELMQAFVKVITKYVVSIDGSVKPNYYNDVWVPWAMKSPLLAQLGIFTTSCYQSEAQKIPPKKSAVVLRYKLKSISMLNEMLQNEKKATSTEAIAAVVYLITNEWYWSNFDNVQAHMRGLREMVRLRGGLGDLGMNGFLRTMILLCDYQIACSYNINLSFEHNISPHVRHSASVSTPLLYSPLKFVSIASDLQITNETATILDDMRFLTMAILKQSSTLSTSEELMKLSTTSSWIQVRILSMPTGSDPTSSLFPDNIYKSVRLASLIYCRSINSRIPLSQACSLADLNLLWSCMWRVTLTRWKQIPGIFIWVILSANQAAQDTPHGRFLKSVFKSSTSYVALDYWDVVDAALMGYVRLTRWLGGAVNGRVEAVNVEEEKGRAMSFLHNYK